VDSFDDVTYRFSQYPRPNDPGQAPW
jgi:hypothetical protein